MEEVGDEDGGDDSGDGEETVCTQGEPDEWVGDSVQWSVGVPTVEYGVEGEESVEGRLVYCGEGRDIDLGNRILLPFLLDRENRGESPALSSMIEDHNDSVQPITLVLVR